MSYYASLYYAMVINNAAVKSAGMHESLIGSGFILGPTAALAGRLLGNVWHQVSLGILAGMIPIVALSVVGGLSPLLRAVQTETEVP